MLNLDGILISSENPQPLFEFYQKILDKDPDWTGGDFKGWKVGSSYLTIGPHSDIKGKNPQSPRIMFFLSTKDVAGEYERIVGLGAKSVQEPYHPEEASEMWLATLEDPDGNYFQLSTPLEV
jgi:predicted enzyme related to lactoylglutathione lyase